MHKSPAFQFYPRDYLSDPLVTCMTLEEQGAYVRLLCHAWDPPCWAGGPKPPVGSLPNDPALLAVLSGFGAANHGSAIVLPMAKNSTANSIAIWEEHSTSILRAFQISSDGKCIIQKRLTEEWQKQQAFKESRARAGKHGAKRRWKRHGSAIGCANGSAIVLPMAKHSSSSSSSSLSDLNTTPLRGGADGKTMAQPLAQPSVEKVGPKPLSLEQALRTLDQVSAGAYVYSPPTKGQARQLQEYVTKHPSPARWELLGLYLRAAYEARGGEALGTPLLSATIGDRMAKAERWDESNRPSLRPIWAKKTEPEDDEPESINFPGRTRARGDAGNGRAFPEDDDEPESINFPRRQ